MDKSSDLFAGRQAKIKMEKKTISRLAITFIIALSTGIANAQDFVSGNYEMGLRLAFDSTTKKISGYFENSTGWDERSKSPRFTCTFYLEGTVSGRKFNIKTYDPTDKKVDLITGTFEIVSRTKVKIKLSEEHGGCWNVMHFADSAANFELEQRQPWTQVRYVDATKAYFYSDKSEEKKLRAYLVKGNVVSVTKIEQDWAYCIYSGRKTTEGWVKIAELNKL